MLADTPLEAFSKEIYAATDREHRLVEIYEKGSPFYSTYLKRPILCPYSNNVWKDPNITCDIFLSSLKRNGDSVTPVSSPISCATENVMRLMNSDQYLDGEIIDACLLLIAAFICGPQDLNCCVLPNQFLTLVTQDTIHEWLPWSVLHQQCSFFIMAAHHPNHWCGVAIDVRQFRVLYMDSAPVASSKKHLLQHLKIIARLCNVICNTTPWEVLSNNTLVAKYLNMGAPPLQNNAVDCGLFAMLHIWMSLCRFLDEPDACCPTLPLLSDKSDMLSLRYFFCCLLTNFSDDDLLLETAEHCDTKNGLARSFSLRGNAHSALQPKFWPEKLFLKKTRDS